MKTLRKNLWETRFLVMAVFAAAASLLCATASATNASLTVNAVETNQDREANHVAHFSPGIPDILKMVDAKIDADVIKAYINSSRIAYNPNVNEIIALKDRGVSSDLLTALLQRGAEVRSQAPAPVAPAPNPYPAVAAPYTPPAAYD